MMGKEFSEEEVLRTSVQQVLKLDLSRRTGWKEGIGYYTDVPVERLIQNGIIVGDSSNLHLTESALMRILEVAVNSAVKDLLENQPPTKSIPEIPQWKLDEDDGVLVYVGLPPGEIVVR